MYIFPNRPNVNKISDWAGSLVSVSGSILPDSDPGDHIRILCCRIKIPGVWIRINGVRFLIPGIWIRIKGIRISGVEIQWCRILITGAWIRIHGVWYSNLDIDSCFWDINGRCPSPDPSYPDPWSSDPDFYLKALLRPRRADHRLLLHLLHPVLHTVPRHNL